MAADPRATPSGSIAPITSEAGTNQSLLSQDASSSFSVPPESLPNEHYRLRGESTELDMDSDREGEEGLADRRNPKQPLPLPPPPASCSPEPEALRPRVPPGEQSGRVSNDPALEFKYDEIQGQLAVMQRAMQENQAHLIKVQADLRATQEFTKRNFREVAQGLENEAAALEETLGEVLSAQAEGLAFLKERDDQKEQSLRRLEHFAKQQGEVLMKQAAEREKLYHDRLGEQEDRHALQIAGLQRQIAYQQGVHEAACQEVIKRTRGPRGPV